MISVIMSVYKEEIRVLEQAIESILQQTYSEFELVIVNDNPTDICLRDYLENKSKQDQRIRLICNDKNNGLVKSLNYALQECNGQYIARMDADDIACKDRLEKQLEWMLEKNIDILGAFVDYINEDGEVIVNHNKKIYKEEQIKKVIRYVNCIYHPTWLVKKEVYDELEGYRDVDACEDYDFLLRANQKNKKIEICNKTLLFYRISKQGISHEHRFEQLAIMQFLQKNYNEIGNLSINKISQYQEQIKANQRMQKYFYKANALHERALGVKRQGKKVDLIFSMFSAMVISPIFFRMYMNMLIVKIKA